MDMSSASLRPAICSRRCSTSCGPRRRSSGVRQEARIEVESEERFRKGLDTESKSQGLALRYESAHSPEGNLEGAFGVRALRGNLRAQDLARKPQARRRRA